LHFDARGRDPAGEFLVGHGVSSVGRNSEAYSAIALPKSGGLRYANPPYAAGAPQVRP
jgi:hypothetical protein